MNGYTNNMDSTRAYKFRIYPDTKRQNEIDERLILAQQFYNKILEKSIESYKNGKAKASMAQFNRFVKEIIQDDKKYLKLYSQTRCEIEYRLLKAYQNFFRRIKEENRKAGFPRFKSRNRYKSITYPQYNGSFSIKRGRLRVSRIGTMRIELHRKIEGTIKTLAIKREGRNYYAVLTTINEIKTPQVEDTNPIGIDMGLNSFVAMSDGTKIEKPKFMQQERKRIAHWQRIVARRNKGSKRREKAKTHLQKTYEYSTNQSDDYLHKLSDRLVDSGYTSFAVEDLHIQNMVKNHRLAGSIQNASWNRFIQMLSYKAESAGMKVIKVDSRDTTQECSNCHHIKEGSERLTLGDRSYRCNVCGLEIDRDINASINILNRATTLGQRESHAQGESVRPQREAVLAELRTDKTHPLRDAVIA
ncbi:IS200/IS605 family transposase OrfB [Candidatus Mancarchaeum acidiphilum]|uniref:IS200/IS605 family transposase OrfB n=1 Tax=Candidatus Mancarchaeum acidiphilum TaxID=1920749 RepID=A0A218NMJ1_9ARCH|nr:RNA-guided endonuclease TnpB family protein [Candidatus Mancarchaeum acidiphilum]ASI13671.1 IS200/IS605 family transposase OrfB [Candidatus Mancarchaeum acidiphilum]